MLSLIRSAQFDEDLIAIWQFVARDSAESATRLLERIDARIQVLPQFPFVGESQPQHGRNARRIIVGNYLVYYDVLDDAIHVLRVFHASRKIENLFR